MNINLLGIKLREMTPRERKISYIEQRIGDLEKRVSKEIKIKEIHCTLNHTFSPLNGVYQTLRNIRIQKKHAIRIGRLYEKYPYKWFMHNYKKIFENGQYIKTGNHIWL